MSASIPVSKKTVAQQTANHGGDVTPAFIAAPVVPLHHPDMLVDGVGRGGVHLGCIEQSTVEMLPIDMCAHTRDAELLGIGLPCSPSLVLCLYHRQLVYLWVARHSLSLSPSLSPLALSLPLHIGD